MGWTRKSRRAAVRNQHRPDIESLEIRTLLSVTEAVPIMGPAVPADGSPGGSGTGYDAIIGASAARNDYKVDGSGFSVAVIDAGVNYTHEALGGGFGEGHKVIAGYDFADNDADPIATNLQHGTAVAGLVASDDAQNPGVAPGADIVALRIFNDSDQGDFNRVGDALQWVIDNHGKYNISVVNLSVSDGRNYTRNWFAQDGGVGQRITDLVAELAKLNIPVVTATGNSFAGQQGAGFSSIIPQTISVTASDASDTIVSNAQRLGSDLGGESATDLAAPGSGLTAPAAGNSFGSVGGTSFAAPLVSGAVVLMQQLYKSRFNTLPSVADVENWLKSGSDAIKDQVTGITIGRLDVPKALALLPTPAAQVLTPPVTPVVPTTPEPTPPVTTPDPVVTQPPADTTVTEPAPSTTSVKIWLNGVAVTSSDLDNTGGRLAGLPSVFLKALKSLKSWWGGSSDSSSRVRVWSSGTVGNTQPAGTVKPLANVGAKATARVAASGKAMPRAWHSFAAGRAGR